jgi:hypothetical protein
MGCRRVMYRELRVVRVDQGGGLIARRYSGWRVRLSTMIIHLLEMGGK